MEKILSLTISVAVKSEVIKVKDLKKVIVDTTVMPKNIEFPTDSKLLGKARERLVKLAAKNGIALRQNYNLVAKTLLVKRFWEILTTDILLSQLSNRQKELLV